MPQTIRHRLLLNTFWLLLHACITNAALAQYVDQLPAAIAAPLKAEGIPVSSVAVIVQETPAVVPRVSVNAGLPVNPASLMKLLTTYAALELIGPAYTWKTEAWMTGTLNDGVLHGDLILKGGGDPKLTFEQFWLLLRQLRARGVRDIRGDLVLDRSLFDTAAGGEAETPFDDQPLRPYNVKPDALLVNFKSMRIQLIADPALKTVMALPEPKPANLEIINQIKPGNGACGSNWKDALHAEIQQGGKRMRLLLNGTYSPDCGEKSWNLGVLSHPQYVFGLFGQLWQELGGTFSGTLRESPIPRDARLLAGIESPTLGEIVRDINKYSNNVMARQLFHTLGIESANRPVRGADADAAIRSWLARKQLDFPELVLENGSGLSRRERISAESLARLLATAWKSPVMPEFIASLPLTAIDGTMKKRLRQNGIAGQAHIKTGSLDNVKAIAGYVLDHRGKWQIVVFIVNHPKAAMAQGAQDALLQWVYEGKN